MLRPPTCQLSLFRSVGAALTACVASIGTLSVGASGDDLRVRDGTALRVASTANLLSEVHVGLPASSWRRTACGSPAAMKPGKPPVDIISTWGREITVDSVKTVFKYPRPQMVRGGASSWHSLNGLWEFEPCAEWGCGPPPFARPMNESVLVPFPVESCLSGLRNHSAAGRGLDVPPSYQHMYYRTHLDATRLRQAASASGGRSLLHFGAVDWQCDVYVNGMHVGGHEGGFDGFSFDISDALELATAGQHELVVQVYDPSNKGSQPFGKQRTEAMWEPGGDTYTPVSGIWQPVWLETTAERHFTSLKLRADMQRLNLTAFTSVPDGGEIRATVKDNGDTVAVAIGKANLPFSIPIALAKRKLWSPESPFLYNLTVEYLDQVGGRTVVDDTVDSYFGMREVSLCVVSGVQRPCINGKWRFLAGFLDQSCECSPWSPPICVSVCLSACPPVRLSVCHSLAPALPPSLPPSLSPSPLLCAYH